MPANMKILRAEHLGMCFRRERRHRAGAGNRETRAADDSGRPRPQRNRAGGIASARESASGKSRRTIGTQTVMITAHGASERRKNETRGLGLNVLEATCPLVHARAPQPGEVGARGISPGHHWQTRPCGSARHDGRPGEFDVVLVRRLMWRACASARDSALLRRPRSRLTRSGSLSG